MTVGNCVFYFINLLNKTLSLMNDLLKELGKILFF